MISDFIVEIDGSYLCHTDQSGVNSARATLDIGCNRGENWNADKARETIIKAMEIFDVKYPGPK